MRKVNHDHEVTGSDVVLIWPQGQDRIIHNRQTHACTKGHYSLCYPSTHLCLPHFPLYDTILRDQLRSTKTHASKTEMSKMRSWNPQPYQFMKNNPQPQRPFYLPFRVYPKEGFLDPLPPPPLKIVYINVLLYDDFHWEVRLGGLCHHGRPNIGCKCVPYYFRLHVLLY